MLQLIKQADTVSKAAAATFGDERQCCWLYLNSLFLGDVSKVSSDGRFVNQPKVIPLSAADNGGWYFVKISRSKDKYYVGWRLLYYL